MSNRIEVYVLTYQGQTVRVGSYAHVNISDSPSVFYSEKAAKLRASRRGWTKELKEVPPNALKVKRFYLVEA